MDVDELSLIFIVEYYEYLVNNKKEINQAYSDNACLYLYLKNNPLRVYRSDFHTAIPNGVRTILSCCGERVGDKLYVHVKSTIAQPSIANVDECFTCGIKGSSILILHHSIHVNPIVEEIKKLPPPPPKPKVIKEPKKEPKPAVELDSPDKVKQEWSIFVKNLSFKVAPKEFIKVLEKYGHVTHFVQGRGKLLAQMEDPKVIGKLTHLDEFEWNGRIPKIIRMPRNIIWD